MVIQRFTHYLGTPLRTHRIADAPVQHITTVQVYDGTQVHKPLSHGYICNIHRPYLVDSFYGKTFEQVGVQPVLLVWLAGILPAVQGLPTHQLHQAFYPLAVNVITLPLQPYRYAAYPIERGLKILLIQQPHDGQVLFLLRSWLVIKPTAMQA